MAQNKANGPGNNFPLGVLQWRCDRVVGIAIDRGNVIRHRRHDCIVILDGDYVIANLN